MSEEELTAYVCSTCGAQYPFASTPPPQCSICEDVRQYVADGGQQWTTLPQLVEGGYQNVFRDKENHLKCVSSEPTFAIGQRSYILKSEKGIILWDCIPFIDEKTISEFETLGEVYAIAISHPHFFSSAVEWSQALGGVPIYVHEENQPWIVRPDTRIEYWKGDSYQVDKGVTLVRCGGHFPGSAVLHWKQGAEGKGVLLTGDTLMVSRDRKKISFMLSYPNYLPLSIEKVEAIGRALEPYSFERIYDGWLSMRENGKAILQESVERYIKAINGDLG